MFQNTEIKDVKFQAKSAHPAKLDQVAHKEPSLFHFFPPLKRCNMGTIHKADITVNASNQKVLSFI